MSHLDPYTFILVDRKPVQHPNDDEWFAWYQQIEENRRVAKTEIGSVSVSTVFTGMDLRPSPGQGLLFETKVFGGALDGEEWLCATWEEAEQQHARVVELAGSYTSPSK